jgi:hypothetical protein
MGGIVFMMNGIDNDIYISSIVTNYNIARNLYIDILFQHGIDIIYYYGSSSSDGLKCSFVHYLEKREETFGFSQNEHQIFDPLNMIDIGCELFSHVDLNYEYYQNTLKTLYKKSNSNSEKKILSRIIGIFEPYIMAKLPIFDVDAIRTEIIKKNLKAKLSDLSKFVEEIKETPPFIDYKNSYRKLGEIDSYKILQNQMENRKKIMCDLVSHANSISKTLGSFLSVVEIAVYFWGDKKRKKRRYNPLLINMDIYHQQAAISALDRIVLR